MGECQVLHGLHPLLPFDLFEATFLVEGFHSGMETSELLALRIRQLGKHDNDITWASEVLKIARLRSKEQFNKRFAKRLQKPDYPKGSLVLVQNNHLEDTLNKFKLDPHYLGPYEVAYCTSKGNYALKELDGTLLHEIYAGFRLISYIQRDDPVLQENFDEEDIPTGEEFDIEIHNPQDLSEEPERTIYEELDTDYEPDIDSDLDIDCLAIITDPESLERTDNTIPEISEELRTQMDPSDIIIPVSPSLIRQITPMDIDHLLQKYLLQEKPL